MDLTQFGLYLVMSDPKIGYEECAKIAVAEGVRVIQLRIKKASNGEYIRIAERVKNALDGTGSVFIINDELCVARSVDADGLHLGQNDMDVDKARTEWSASGKILGLSTHAQGQDEAAQKSSADYIGVGPVFPTPTKDIPDPILGLEKMKEIIARSKKPCVAIGGIDLTNIRDVLAAGAKNYAVVRAICKSDEPAKIIRKFKAIEKEFGIG